MNLNLQIFFAILYDKLINLIILEFNYDKTFIHNYLSINIYLYFFLFVAKDMG